MRVKVLTSLAIGIAVEALTPNKISTVSYVKSIKDLNIIKFIATAPVLYSTYNSILTERAGGVPRVGYWIRKGVEGVINNPLIGTNTCLGYLILTVPIALAIRELDENSAIDVESLVSRATELVLNYSAKEPASDFYEAIRTANPSYKGRYFGGVPDLSSGDVSKHSLLDVLIESSYWDLTAYEVTHYYDITLKAYEHMSNIYSGCKDLLKSVRDAQLYLLRNYLDSEVVKSVGVSEAVFIKNYLSLTNILSDEVVSEGLLSNLDNYLRGRGVNTGTLADVLALATALTLINN